MNWILDDDIGLWHSLSHLFNQMAENVLRYRLERRTAVHAHTHKHAQAQRSLANEYGVSRFHFYIVFIHSLHATDKFTLLAFLAALFRRWFLFSFLAVCFCWWWCLGSFDYIRMRSHFVYVFVRVFFHRLCYVFLLLSLPLFRTSL